ncbi:peptidylprolyl isomerase [Pseudoluteimonas lycopersici]|uniref:peptidylprolyl isomerase n=1 Tax=Pseudoluteimonas lycopersici TaxID=1324796 RepID=A0A516V1S8_9GAMM|nr:peptidylprolyl isomerase [Lysobacter lycopersici]QDQ72472.1 peptidylprolyl isomerase [Lysobacter lycopersici]
MPAAIPSFARVLILAAVLVPTFAVADTPDKKPYRSAKEIIDAAPASAWRDLDPANTLYMQLPAGRVVIELAPGFAPNHVANIKALAQGGFWDGTSIYRSQDNFVVQFGDADADDPAKAKHFPANAKDKLPAEFTRNSEGVAFDKLPDVDGWAPQVGFADGFPVARDPKTSTMWMTHCYGIVGAGRNNDPASSTGAELYVVIGQAPRALDRNLTLVGRVVKGMELLSAIPRGPDPMGFYEKPEQRTPIVSIKLASDVPESERTPLQLLRTDIQAFRDATEARRNRVDDFYQTPAGHIDLCNVPLPTRDPMVKADAGK